MLQKRWRVARAAASGLDSSAHPLHAALRAALDELCAREDPAAGMARLRV